MILSAIDLTFNDIFYGGGFIYRIVWKSQFNIEYYHNGHSIGGAPFNYLCCFSIGMKRRVFI